jgi:hypothetical protein
MNDSEKIAAMETKVATLEGRAPVIEEALKSHEARLNGMTQGFNRLEKNVDANQAVALRDSTTLERQLMAIRDDVQTMKEAIAPKPPPGPSRASRAWTWLKENRPPVKDLVLWVLIAVMFAGMVVMFFELRDRPPGPTPTPPVPPKPPEPPAPIPLQGFRVVIMYDKTKLDAGREAVVYGLDVRNALEAKCVMDPDTKSRAYWIIPAGADVSAAPRWVQDVIQKHPAQKEWMVASNGKTGYDGVIPANKVEALTIIQKYGD